MVETGRMRKILRGNMSFIMLMALKSFILYHEFSYIRNTFNIEQNVITKHMLNNIPNKIVAMHKANGQIIFF